MLYHLFDFLARKYDLPGAGLFQYISFRAVAAVVLSLLVTIVFGGTVIKWLRSLQVKETVRDLGLAGENQKQGTPTMGGIMILAGIVIPVLLIAPLNNVYIQLLLVTTVWLGLIGFLDDYIKVFKKDKKGLHGKFKIVGQIGLGVLVGSVLYFHPQVTTRTYLKTKVSEVQADSSANFAKKLDAQVEKSFKYIDVKSTRTTVPFFKNNELDYSAVIPFLPKPLTWVFYVLVVTFIITAVSNGANITDGIDGLAAGVSAIIGLTLAILAYVSGNTVFSQYLNIMYIPQSGEIVIFCLAFTGACVGYLWYNAYPAQVFMGDTGSLALGGIIAVLALSIRKELLIPVLCGIFLVENISVLIQVTYFKYTKKKYGEGRRIFKMAPLHHHYQKMGYHESKIVTRFLIIGVLLAALTIATLKIR